MCVSAKERITEPSQCGKPRVVVRAKERIAERGVEGDEGDEGEEGGPGVEDQGPRVA